MAAGGVPVAPKTPMPTLHRARIYASPDPLFAKLPKLQTPIAKRLETTICAFCQKNQIAKLKCTTVGSERCDDWGDELTHLQAIHPA
jgi:hypothetical protein